MTTAVLNSKPAEVKGKILGTTNLATKSNTQYKSHRDQKQDTWYHRFNRLTKINFNTRMKEVTKYLVSKSQIDTNHDVADENKEETIKTWDV